MPRHGTTLAYMLDSCRQRFAGDIRPGDMYLVNDPHAGALHSLDIAVMAPVFVADDLVAVIERKMLVPNIHFARAARDFSDIGLAIYPKDERFLYYRAYLSEDIKGKEAFERNMFLSEIKGIDHNNQKVQKLVEFTNTKFSSGSDRLTATKDMGVAMHEIYKNAFREEGYMYPTFRNGKMIYVFPNGEKAIDDVYDFCTMFLRGYARVMKDGLWGMIDVHGNTVLPCLYKTLGASMSYEYYGSYSDLFYSYSRNPNLHTDEWGYVGVSKITDELGLFSIMTGKWIFKPEGKFITYVLTKDRILTKKDVQTKDFHWKIFDEKGNIIKDNANHIGGFLTRKHMGKVVDGWFKIPVKFTYLDDDPISWTFVNTDGDYVFGEKVVFDEIIDENFVDGKCKVRIKKDIFYIDKTGKRIK